MNINLTLIAQSIVFIVFVWFCMKFVWPPIMNALMERKKQIADGLEAAERGQREFRLAEKRSIDVIKEAKQRASEIINQAEKRAGEIHDESKESAKADAERIVHAAQGDIEELRQSVAELVVSGARKILKKEIDAKAHAQLLDDVAKQL
jgi:F-type H+-transporting ATPase subunit b